MSLLKPAILASIIVSSVPLAHAEAGGLRLKDHIEGITLPAPGSGLKLHFVPAPRRAAPPALAASSLNETVVQRNSLRADWQWAGKSLHTTLGLDWSDITHQAGTHDYTSSDAIPFFGLGWDSGSSKSRWRLSAEIGTAFAAGQPCNALVGCASLRSSGLNPYSTGSGLRLNPYVNFGATYTFSQ